MSLADSSNLGKPLLVGGLSRSHFVIKKLSSSFQIKKECLSLCLPPSATVNGDEEIGCKLSQCIYLNPRCCPVQQHREQVVGGFSAGGLPEVQDDLGNATKVLKSRLLEDRICS